VIELKLFILEKESNESNEKLDHNESNESNEKLDLSEFKE
jgi:hypothetical protein